MKRIYDWQYLRNKFIAGKWLAVADFFRSQNIKNNSRNRLNARGWVAERRTYREKISRQSLDKSLEDEVEIRRRHQKLATQLQLKGLKELESLPITDVDDARKLLVDGMREEREALGLNSQKTKTSNLTQVNVNLPRTKFDEMIDSASFEEILEFIVVIRKEKARRLEVVTKK